MKFIVDMGISPSTAAFLRQLDYDAVHLHELGLGHMSDVDILAKAHEERRIVLTHDLDFPDMMAASAAHLPSIVVFRLRRMQPSNVNRHLRYVVSEFESALTSGAIITVTENRVRVRELPIKPH